MKRGGAEDDAGLEVAAVGGFPFEEIGVDGTAIGVELEVEVRDVAEGSEEVGRARARRVEAAASAAAEVVEGLGE